MDWKQAIVILAVILICGVASGGLYMSDSTDRGVSIYGPVDGATVSDEVSVTEYEELTEEEQSVFREHQEQIHKEVGDSYQIGPSETLYSSVEVIELDGGYYFVNEYNPSAFETDSGLTSVLLLSLSGVSLIGLIYAESVLYPFTKLYLMLPRTPLSLSQEQIKTISVAFGVLVVVLSSAMFFTLPIDKAVSLEQVTIDDKEEAHIVSYTDLTEHEQEEFVNLVDGESSVSPESLALTQSSIEYIQSDGEVYTLAEQPISIQMKSTLAIVGGIITGGILLGGIRYVARLLQMQAKHIVKTGDRHFISADTLY